MKPILLRDKNEILRIISKDRVRTNLLKNSEQQALVYLVQRIPSWMTSDMLTFIGFIGSLTVLTGFLLATYINKYFLLLGLLGFAINWFGDSLDGRLAFYRNQSRKWYGFSLDITMDWISTILIGCGYMFYVTGYWELLGFGFVVMYGWAMITALLRYKVTGKYIIDAGLMGPTEVRICLSAILIAEVLIKDAILFSGIVACIILLIVNIFEMLKLLRVANDRDVEEKEEKLNHGNN